MKAKYTFPCGCSFPVLEENPPPDCVPLIDVNLDDIPEDCPATWGLLGKGLTKGVFQLETPLGRQWTKKMAPTSCEHMSALGALLRPGAMANVDEEGVSTTMHYIRRRHGQEAVKPFHPAVDAVLHPTYNLLTYQEQAMALCVAVAGFTGQQADNLRRAIGKKIPEEMAKCKTMFFEGAKAAGILTDEQAQTVFGWIEKSQRYSFNKCASEHEIIRRPNGGRFSKNNNSLTIGEMYRIRNDISYAKASSHLSLYKKWKLIGNYGKGLSRGDDGRIRPNTIRDIQPAGRRLVYRVTVEGGKSIDVTDNHKFPTNKGEMSLSDIMLTDRSSLRMYACGEYESTDFTIYNFSKTTIAERKTATGRSGKGTAGPENRWYTNGSFTDFENNRKQLPEVCQDCGKMNCRFETHHVDGNREDSSLGNLALLCASCHKKREYAAGRTRRGEKGYPSLEVCIVSIEPVCEVETYDVTMDGPNHNFVVASGIVTSNSHSSCYGVTGYQTAYAKAHHPLAFFASWLRNAKHKQDPQQEVYELVNDARLFDIAVEPPDIRSLHPTFHTDRRVVKFGIGNVKGIGAAALKKIRAGVRDAEGVLGKKIGEFGWLEFLAHCSGKLPAAAVVNLIRVGAFRQYKTSRAEMEAQFKAWDELTDKEREWAAKQEKGAFTSLPALMRAMARPKKDGGGAANKKRILVINSLVDLLENPRSARVDSPIQVADMEEQLLGISVSCAKIDSCDVSHVNTSCKEFLAGRTGFMLLGVEIKECRELKTKSGKAPGSRYGRMTLDDGTCTVDAVCWPEQWREFGPLIKDDGSLVIVQVDRDFKDPTSSTAIVKKAWKATRTG